MKTNKTPSSCLILITVNSLISYLMFFRILMCKIRKFNEVAEKSWRETLTFPKELSYNNLRKPKQKKKFKSTFLTFSFDTRTLFGTVFYFKKINREKYAILSFPFLNLF